MSELEKVKVLIGLDIDDEETFDEFITLQLDMANELINNLTMSPDKYKNLKINAVVFAYNQQGYEGQKSGGTMGINATWMYSTMDKYIRSHMDNQLVVI